MKRFYDFLKQVFFGDSGGLGSKTANMTVDQLVKVGTDMKLSPKEAEKLVTAFLTKTEDKALAELTTSLGDTKKMMTTDEMIEAEMRSEFIDGKAADTMSFEEFKLMKEAESKQAAQNIIANETPPDEFFGNPDVTVDLGPPGGFTEMQKTNKLGQFATDPRNVSNYDELVKQGYYVDGTMKPGPSHPFNNPQKISEVRSANDGGPMTSKVVSNIASWKQDLIRNLDEGIITRSEYDQYYRNASDIFDAEYAKAKQIDMQNGFVENTYDNRNADKLIMDYYPGENYAAKYTSEADIAVTGYVPSDSSLARNKESSDFIKKMIEEPIITEGKILTSQTNELKGYTRALEDAMDSGDMVEAERIKDLLEDVKKQQDAGTPVTDIIFNDSKRSLNAMGGIIQGAKNRGRR
jgi:hypothetical protein